MSPGSPLEVYLVGFVDTLWCECCIYFTLLYCM